MNRETDERAVVTHPHRAGTKLLPVIVHVGDVLEFEARTLRAFVEDPHLDPADAAAELPRCGEFAGRIAGENGAVGVAVEVISAADAKVAGDRQEPPRNAFDARAGVPQVGGVGVVRLADGDDAGLYCLQRPVADRALYGTDLLIDVDHGALLRRCRFPRAISVASASSFGAQKRRKPASHSSTSRSASPLTAYSRRCPSGRTEVKPLSRNTFKCCETAGWLISNSAWMAAPIAPAVCSPSTSSSRMRRRTGSPRTSNACTSRD